MVDAAGNAYLACSAVGSGYVVHKYSPSGALLWSQRILDRSAATTSHVAGVEPGRRRCGGDGECLAAAPTGSRRLYDTTTGTRRWLVTAAEGIAATDVVVDSGRVYVTGQGYTGAGTPALAYFLTVVAYDRATGARLWRTDKKPADGTSAAGLRMSQGA